MPLTQGRAFAIMNAVQFGGIFVNNIVTSREEILQTSRALLRDKGWDAVNIRGVAAACGVSVGSIYNYFGSKEELTSAVVESVWHEIFRCPEGEEAFSDTLGCIRWLYGRMAAGCRDYPGFFTLHAVGLLQSEKAAGKQRMEKSWHHIRQMLEQVLRRDPNVRPEAFSGGFTPAAYAQILFSLLLGAMLRGDYDPAAVLEVTRRTLY